MNTKPLFKSKIVWVQIIAGLLAILELLNPDLLVSLGVPPNSTPKVLAWIGFVTMILTIVLRKFSNTTISALLVLLMLGVSSCNFTKQAQTYLQKHCPKTTAVNPITGNLEIHYECDSLWGNAKLKQSCSSINVCIDAVNGRITGDVKCDSLVNVPKLLGAAKAK